MRKFAVIGDPIEHSLSPVLHNWVYSELGLTAQYSKIYATHKELPVILRKVKNSEMDGLNVTIPHKSSIMSFLDIINPRAKAIGAVNVISCEHGKLYGNNTDWYGFSMAFKMEKIDVVNKDIIVVGGGGVSKGVIFALKQMGVSHINIFNRTFEKISGMNDNQISPHPFEDLNRFLKNDSIVVNCTSVGMNSEESPISSSYLSPTQTIIDTIYIPLKTTLIKEAERLGAKTINGLDMFIYQGLASIDLWFGEGTTSKVNLEELKRHIESHLC